MEMNYVEAEKFWDLNAIGKHYVIAGSSSDLITGQFRHNCELRRLNKIVNFEDKKLLELGCGSSRWGISLIKTLKRYVGVDISAKQIGIAKGYLTRNNTKLIVSNLTDFNTKEVFDIIYFSGVLQYMNDKDVSKLIEKATKWLNLNGVLISRDSIARGNRFVKQRGIYKTIYRGRTEHLYYFHNFTKIDEVDSYFNPPILLLKILKKALPNKLYNFFSVKYLSIIYPIEPFLMKYCKFLFIRRIRHKFFVFIKQKN